MKAIVALGITFSMATISLGQGLVNFANVGAGIANAYITNGVTCERVVVGRTFLVQLYYANGVINDSSLFISVDGDPIGFAAPGIFVGGIRWLEDISPSGGIGSFQVRSWSSSLGATYEEAYANWMRLPSSPTRLLGAGNVFANDTVDPYLHVPGPYNLVGQQGFALLPNGGDVCIPEPRSLLLWGTNVLGILCWWFFGLRRSAAGAQDRRQLMLARDDSSLG